ncbi:MAG TPA: biopolymer transporter ExbD [Rhabdochlamydiaceae bacterium]|jgi:biopolymer transport protein ExbD
MSIIPEEEFKRFGSVNLAPMVDFLFLVVAVFATLAVTRSALFDNDVELVKVRSQKTGGDSLAQNQQYIINLSIDEQGRYKWITEFNEYWIDGVLGIRQELERQVSLGLLPKEKERTKVLVHIDKHSQWDPIAQLIFAVRETGFDIHPVYDYDECTTKI